MDGATWLTCSTWILSYSWELVRVLNLGKTRQKGNIKAPFNYPKGCPPEEASNLCSILPESRTQNHLFKIQSTAEPVRQASARSPFARGIGAEPGGFHWDACTGSKSDLRGPVMPLPTMSGVLCVAAVWFSGPSKKG